LTQPITPDFAFQFRISEMRPPKLELPPDNVMNVRISHVTYDGLTAHLINPAPATFCIIAPLFVHLDVQDNINRSGPNEMGSYYLGLIAGPGLAPNEKELFKSPITCIINECRW